MKAENKLNEFYNKICAKRLTLQSIIDKQRNEYELLDSEVACDLFELFECLDSLSQSLRVGILDMYTFAHSYIVNNEESLKGAL